MLPGQRALQSQNSRHRAESSWVLPQLPHGSAKHLAPGTAPVLLLQGTGTHPAERWPRREGCELPPPPPASPGCSARPFQLEQLQLRPLCREMGLGFAVFEMIIRKAEQLLCSQLSWAAGSPCCACLDLAQKPLPARLQHRHHLKVTGAAPSPPGCTWGQVAAAAAALALCHGWCF